MKEGARRKTRDEWVDVMAFNIDAKVSFESTRHGRLFGTLVKFNRKTVTMLTEAGQQWKVSPHLLTDIKDAALKQHSIHVRDIEGE